MSLREQQEELLDSLNRKEAEFGEPAVFRFRRPHRLGQVAIRLQQPGHVDDWPIRALEADLKALDDADLVRRSGAIEGPRTTFGLTEQARQRYREKHSHTMVILEPLIAEPSDDLLDWATQVLPVLRAVYTAYNKRLLSMGVSQDHVNAVLARPLGDPHTDIVLANLLRDGYLEATMEADQQEGPLFCRLTGKGLQVVAGWPGAGVAAERLLTVLDAQIDEAGTDDARSRLIKLREAVTGVGTDIVAKIVSNVVTGT